MFFYINFLLHRARGMTLRWSGTYKKVQVEKFSSSSGPKVILPSTILEVFLCFFTEELLRMITDQSNLYAEQCMGEEMYQLWNRITVEEVKAYLGFFHFPPFTTTGQPTPSTTTLQ